MQRGRKKIENPETARRILAAAERIFAARGLAGARTDEIARAAHVNKAMLYYYFRSKERLYRAVFENLFGQCGKNDSGGDAGQGFATRGSSRVRGRIFQISGSKTRITRGSCST